MHRPEGVIQDRQRGGTHKRPVNTFVWLSNITKTAGFSKKKSTIEQFPATFLAICLIFDF
jgi:hypothetical protein